MEKRIFSMLKELQPSFDFEEDVDFVSAGYLDSFDVVQLVAELEATFGVIISALDILPENFASVAAIKQLVERSPKRENPNDR
ncbi:MAG: acyl carrier protein [Desulfovibrionaceae bacterium]|nr:acyl carrier protein [Desulfovibrionaceae bacterium]